jgi:hypothetical protein
MREIHNSMLYWRVKPPGHADMVGMHVGRDHALEGLSSGGRDIRLFQVATVSSVRIPVSTSVHPSPSSKAQTLMWSSL